MKANRVYQITRSKQITDCLSNLLIKKVKLFKDNEETKLYFYLNNNSILTIISPQSIEWYGTTKRRK